MQSLGQNVINVVLKAIFSFFLKIDGVIYNLICWFYDLFMFLAGMDIFKNADYENIVRRIYIILGVIMLFIMTYSLLKAVINPDDFSKGENSFANIIKNVVVSLVMITLMPTVFDVAFQVQNVILRSNVIEKLILSDDFTSSAISGGGRTMAVTIFQAFFRYNEDADTSEDYGGDVGSSIKTDLAVTFNQVERGLDFQVFSGKYTVVDGSGEERNFPELILDKVIDYTLIVSSVAGAFVLWCLVLFCFDLGIRIVKLAFYQLIAPIAIVCRVLPNKKAKDIFGNWTKLTFATFLEVFIRIFVMYIGVYFIILVANRGPDILAYALESGLKSLHALFAEAFVIMGIIAFIRQAPKLIQDVFGLDTGNMKLGFKGLTERLGDGGAFAAAGLVGGTAGGFGQRLRDARTAGRHGWRAATSALAGGLGGGRRAFMRNLGSHSFEDFRNNTTGGINDTLERGRRNDRYRAGYGSVTGGRLRQLGEFLGFDDGLGAYRAEKEFYAQITAIDDNSDASAGELLNRDLFSSGRSGRNLIASAIAASGDATLQAQLRGMNMSYGEMQRLMETVQNTDVNAMLTNNGGSFTVTDFAGNTQTITDARRFAQYAQEMQSQFNAVERHAKTFIKTQGYAGAAGVANLQHILGHNLGGGEMQRMHSLESDARNARDLFEHNTNMVNVLNDHTDPAHRVNGIRGYADMDQWVSNAKDRTRVINADIESLQRRRGNDGNNN